MKKKILFALTFLVVVLLISCSTTKQIKSTQGKVEQSVSLSANRAEPENIKVSPVKLPETKESLEQINRNYEVGNEYKEDYYGTKFNDYKNIPIYDINNLPISVWFIKQEDDHKGFIVAGHATKAICEVASLEVHNKIKSLGKSESSIFSFGIGHNILGKNEINSKYNENIEMMKSEFEELEKQNKEEVSVNEIDYDRYIEYQMMFENHIKLAKKSNEYDTHIVEYKLDNFPIIAPFYFVDSSEIIKIKVPKNIFGVIPTELVFASYQKYISEIEIFLNEKISSNKTEVSKIIKFKNSDEEALIWEIEYFVLEGISIYEKSEILYGYSPPPDDFLIQEFELDKFGHKILINSRPITFKEALTYLNTPEIIKYTEPTLIRQLREWKIKAVEERNSFEQRKRDLIYNIEIENNNLDKFLTTIRNRKLELLSRDNNDYIIDAFLRGWVFDTDNDKLNKDLDRWYNEKREVVWNYYLDNVPNSRINEKLAGIFHSDDVFFQIESKESYFVITPYKVVGGEFIQIIDKQIGISYVQSPFNFRLTQN